MQKQIPHQVINRAAEMLRNPDQPAPYRRISGLLGPTAQDIATQPAVLASISRIKMDQTSGSRPERLLARTRGALASLGSRAVRNQLQHPDSPVNDVIELASNPPTSDEVPRLVITPEDALMGHGPEVPMADQTIDTSIKE